LTTSRGSSTLGARNARWEGIMPGGTYGIVGLVVAIIVALVILRLAGIL
jgi:hypothetical protein